MLVKLLLLLLFLSPGLNAESSKPQLATMSLEEKIAQLFIMPVNFDCSEQIFENQKKICAQNQIGGVIFLHHGTSLQQYHWMEELKKLTKIPLLFCQDAEWGLAMRLRDVPTYPKAMVLGALKDDQLIYELGKKVGQDCKAMGIHMNIAPVIDVNSNPKNPIIGMRSFGDKPWQVATKATAYFKGIQDSGVLTCAKHFPGHGDTSKDSHIDLPVIPYDRVWLNNVELIPFRHAIANNIDAIMTAHIHVPALDDRLNRPVSLSYNVTTKLLRKELGFNGLIVTDALDMLGVTNHFAPGEIAREAFLAGADILLCSTDIPAGIQAIKDAIVAGEIEEVELDRRVLKILKLKKKVIEPQDLSYEKIDEIIHEQEGPHLKRAIYEQAITIAFDNNRVPLDAQKNVAIIEIGNQTEKFCRILEKHLSCSRFFLPVAPTYDEIAACMNEIKQYDSVVFALHTSAGLRLSCSNSNELISFIKNQQRPSILVVFGSPYAISHFQDLDTVMVAYDNDPEAQRAAALVLAGKLPALGKLPVNVFEH